MTTREAVAASLRLMTRRDRRLLILAMVLQGISSLLDLLGVLLMGLVGALAVTTIQSQPPPAIVSQVSQALGLDGLSPQTLVAVLAAAAALVLLMKSAMSAVLLRRVFVFLANRQALVSARLARDLLAQPITFLQQRSSQETAFALIQGAGFVTLSVLGQLVIIVTEVSVLVVLSVALLFIDPWVTLGAIAFFAVVALLLYRLMGSWATRLGEVGTEADIASLNTLQDALATYREISVLNRRSHYIGRFQQLRWIAASVSADRTFLMQVPKYVFEAALVLGGVVLAGVLFLTEDSVSAVGTLALFIAAASRVMPSLLRLQGAALTIRDHAAAGGPTLLLAEQLRGVVGVPVDEFVSESALATPCQHSPASIAVTSVNFRYPGSIEPVLREVSLDISPGASLAIVGRSGSGKSTLADLILGVLDPDSGTVRLDGVPPRQLASDAPGSLAYVPQVVSLINGTVRDNVALGLDPEEVSDDLIWSALTRAHLSDVIRAQPKGLNTHVGDDGMKLSGGQRQRLGIARALLSNPGVLLMDEATSALDAETEAALTETIEGLHGHVTVVIIAHRLSTVRHADQVAYMDSGRIVDQDSFDALRLRVPALDHQASLMGLN